MEQINPDFGYRVLSQIFRHVGKTDLHIVSMYLYMCV